MTYSEKRIRALHRNCICVGLDPDIKKFPECVRNHSDPVIYFNRSIVDATIEYTGAFKLNFAFYESLGADGWRILKETVQYIRQSASDVLIIADAKRGDIGNTADQYAKAIFDELGFDCLTVNPYMGHDSIEPFIQNPKKGAFILCLTSNPGSKDFQYFSDGQFKLFERVAVQVASWDHHGNCGLVVGATHSSEMQGIRSIASDLPFLIPGIGAQGGDLESAVRINRQNGFVNSFINVSRSVIYASTDERYSQAANQSAKELHNEIQRIISIL
jgi:orotidine-5'-phosphate decarboxylase